MLTTKRDYREKKPDFVVVLIFLSAFCVLFPLYGLNLHAEPVLESVLIAEPHDALHDNMVLL